MKSKIWISGMMLLSMIQPVTYAEHISIPTALEECEQCPMTITVTGLGKVASRHRSQAQERLMAERAATVSAYQGLLNSFTRLDTELYSNDANMMDSHGFIQGASIIQKRYFSNGDVEVDMAMTIMVPRTYIQKHPKVYTFQVDKSVKEITKEEWENIFKGKQGDQK